MLCATAACGEQESATAAENDAAEDEQEIGSTGDALAAVDPQNYFGLYGDPASPDERRGMFFVTEARPPQGVDGFPDIPPGYIMIGAVWADVAPWYMKPLSDTAFEQDFLGSFDPEPLRVAFELDSEGAATALTFENRQEEFRERARVGDLPEEYR